MSVRINRQIPPLSVRVPYISTLDVESAKECQEAPIKNPKEYIPVELKPNREENAGERSIESGV